MSTIRAPRNPRLPKSPLAGGTWIVETGGTGGGGGSTGAGNYSTTFTAATTVTILGTTHNLGTSDLIIAVYDNSTPAQVIFADAITVDVSTYDVVVHFSQATSGKVVINARGGTGSSITGATLPITVQISANATLTPVAQTVEADATTAALTATLPLVATWTGQDITIVKVDASAHVVNWALSGSDTVDGVSSGVLTQQWQTIVIRATDATKGQIVTQFLPSASPAGVLGPNITSVTPSVAYGLEGNTSVFAAGGTIALPTGSPDYSHLKKIVITQRKPTGTPLFVAELNGPFVGSTVAFVGATVAQSYLAEAWDWTFEVYNEDGIPTPSPYVLFAVPIHASHVSACNGTQVSFTYAADPQTRRLTTQIAAQVQMVGGQYPQVATLYYNRNDGEGWRWGATTRVLNDTDWHPVIVNPPATTDSGWKIAAIAGAWPLINVPFPTLPSDAVQSATFTVNGVSLPSATLVHDIVVAPAPSADVNHPYNALTEDGNQYINIGSVGYDDTDCLADPFAHWVRITAQDYDAAGNPVSPEGPQSGEAVSGGTHTSPAVITQYGLVGYGVDRPANIASIRFRAYVINEIDLTSYSFTDGFAARLQTDVGGGLGYKAVLVATGGVPPAGKVSAVRIDPSTLGFGLNTTSNGLEIGTNDLTNAILNPRWDSGTAHWQLVNGAALVAGASETGGNALQLNANDETAVTAYPKDLIGCAPGQQWYFSVRAKNDASTTGHVDVSLSYHANPDFGGEAMASLPNIMPGAPGVWADYGAVITVPATIGTSGHVPSFMEVILHGNSISAGAFYIDRVRLDPQTFAGSGTEAEKGGIKIKYGAGTEADGSGALQVKVGNGLALSGSQLISKLASLGGLSFDGSGNTQANLGYTMTINGSGQIVLANLPAVFGLPSLPSATYPQGSVILNTADNKIYRNPSGSAWAKSSDPADLVAGAVASGVTIAAASITSGTLISGVVYAGQINASQVNAGTFNGMALVLNDSGVTSSITNQFDSTFGSYVGLKIADNSSGVYGSVGPRGFQTYYPSGGSNAILTNQISNCYMQVSCGGGATVSASSGFSQFSMHAGGAAVLIINTSGSFAYTAFPTSNPGLHLGQVWCDTSAGNVLKCDR